MTHDDLEAVILRAVTCVRDDGTAYRVLGPAAIAAILDGADQYAAHLVELHAHNGTGPCQASVSAVHAERQRTREAIAPLLTGEPDGDACVIRGLRWVRAGRVREILGMGRSWDPHG